MNKKWIVCVFLCIFCFHWLNDGSKVKVLFFFEQKINHHSISWFIYFSFSFLLKLSLTTKEKMKRKHKQKRKTVTNIRSDRKNVVVKMAFNSRIISILVSIMVFPLTNFSFIGTSNQWTVNARTASTTTQWKKKSSLYLYWNWKDSNFSEF